MRIGFYSESTPAMDTNGTLYVISGEGILRAIEPYPYQSIKWTSRFPVEIKSSPAIGDDGTIYFGCRDRNFYAVSPQGKTKWHFKTGAWVDSSPAIATDGTIYFGSWDNTFYALNPDGTKRWTFATGAPIDSSPAIGADGTIYFGSHDKIFYALNPNGSRRWAVTNEGAIISSPAIGPDGAIYYSSVDGKLSVLNADGTVRWQKLTGGITAASPVLGTNGSIFVGVNTNFCAFSADGKPLWSHRIWQYRHDDYIHGAAAVGADGRVYFGSDDHRLWRLRCSDGDWLPWHTWLSSPSRSSVLIGQDSTVYLVSYAIHLFGLTNVTTFADTSWPMFRADPRHTGRVRKTATQ